MRYTTVRVKSSTRDLLRDLASREGIGMQAVLERALESYRRRSFLEDVNAAYAELRADEGAWAAVEHERAVWDATLADGLPTEPAAAPRAPKRPRKPPPSRRGGR